MAKLINGNGNPAVYAAEDADLIASIMGDKTSICNLGSKFAATASGANVIEVADGVIITKEGRRIQLDSGSVDEFSIPAGTVGTTNYYIIGYKLYENAQVQQVCETFVQLMPNSTDVIQEDTFKGGATEVYVSLYRVEQDGVNLGTITALLPEIGNISEINTDLSETPIYDKATGKWYERNDDGTRGDEIQVGGRLLDYANTVNLTVHTRVPLDYTPTKDGELCLACRIVSSGDQCLYMDGKKICAIPPNNILDPIWFKGIKAGTHIYTVGSLYEDANEEARTVTYIPYL